ncbi:MAG TPA: type III-A CRISPR-associated RAMP protein Csm4 [Fervidobacterium sp.]|nr:type III-A CRISPR-associated RAMP protein Csm4 [Fervidobacterium sp.]HCL99011.1 type III-A CRISPR-associated RAMP protein Csm4 [Fervidobacterium sp.]HOK88028.1 type III-A CRISPR-associated RAMP protein Csm4 [Fervidobacterium sp.]HUM76342.1 type III-A CRISPR-associated RAMP protein Csm4 [Fervidobacterium sp.]
MRKYRVKLKLLSPFHVGYREGDYTVSEVSIPSDTLFSGIINAFSLLYGKEETDKLVDAFLNGEFPFKVSSTFPYCGDEFFYPKPLNYSANTDNAKSVSKAKYISERLLFQRSSENIKDIQISYGFISSKELGTPLYILEKRPRVSLDKITSASEIYYIQLTRYSSNAGLWFFLDVEDEYEKRIRAAIKLLGDEGIGGERTIGAGFFEPEFTDTKEEYAGDSYISLSSFIPKAEECAFLKFYELQERTGFIYSPYESTKKHKIYTMVKEGAILSGKVEGMIVDGTPEDFPYHKVLKYGLAYLVALQ